MKWERKIRKTRKEGMQHVVTATGRFWAVILPVDISDPKEELSGNQNNWTICERKLVGDTIIGKDKGRKQILDIRPNSYGSHTLENDQGSWKVKREASFLTVTAKVMRLFTKQATLLESVQKGVGNWEREIFRISKGEPA